MKRAVAAAIAALFVSACATQESMKAFKCDAGPFPVTVFYNEYIAVLEPIVVRGKDKWICWQLDADAAGTYKFVADSISIDDKGDGAFTNCKKGDKDGSQDGFTRIRCHDKNPKKEKYKYGIRLERQDGRQGPPPYDPLIVND
jgi:hypothetical protein